MPINRLTGTLVVVVVTIAASLTKKHSFVGGAVIFDRHIIVLEVASRRDKLPRGDYGNDTVRRFIVCLAICIKPNHDLSCFVSEIYSEID